MPKTFLLICCLLCAGTLLASIIEVQPSQRNHHIADENTLVVPAASQERFLIINNLNNYYTIAEHTVADITHQICSTMSEHGEFIIRIPAAKNPSSIQLNRYIKTRLQTQISTQLVVGTTPEHTQALKLMAQAYRDACTANFGTSSTPDQSVANYLQVTSLQGPGDALVIQKALAHFSLSAKYFDLGNNTQAVQHINQAIALWPQNHHTMPLAQFHNMAGLIQWQLSDLTQAEQHFKHAQKTYKAHDRTNLITQTHNNLGLIQWSDGRIQESNRSFQRALELVNINLSLLKQDPANFKGSILKHPGRDSIIPIINNLGLTEDALGNIKQAETLFRMYMALSEHALDAKTHAIAQNNLASFLINKGVYDQARHLLNKAKLTFIQEKSQRWQGFVQHNFGQIYTALGLYELAMMHFDKALNHRKISNNPKGHVDTLIKQIEILVKRRQWADTQTLLEQLEKLASTHQISKATVFAHHTRHQLAMATKDHESAQLHLDQALEKAEGRHYRRTHHKLHLAQAALYQAQSLWYQSLDVLTRMIPQVHKHGYPDMLTQALNLQTTAHIVLGELPAAKSSITESLSTIQAYERSSENLKTKHQIMLKLKSGLRLNALVASRLNEIEAAFTKHHQIMQNMSQTVLKSDSELMQQLADKSFALENPKLSHDDRRILEQEITYLLSQIEFAKQSQPEKTESITLASMQKLLPTDTVLIQFFISPVGGVSWWISSDQVHKHEFVGLDAIKTLVAASRQEFSGQRRGRANRDELSKVLLEPLQQYSGVKKLIVILDEPLNLIPFNALTDPTRKNEAVLIEHFTIRQIIPGFGDVNPKQASRKANLVFADPITTHLDPRLNNTPEPLELNFPRLVSSAHEAGQIGSTINSRIFKGHQASKATLVQNSKQAVNTLHFATHAFFNDQNPNMSALVMSAYDEKGQRIPAFLRALEIKNMPINANLVVLSGCETGINSIEDAYGFGGLTQAFLDAGASQLLASLWRVDDRVTALLMAGFYQAKATGMSNTDALRTTQNSLRKNPLTRDPKYWAGWYLISRDLGLKRK